MIEGKIAEISDQYRVIINKGRQDGVKNNMRFYVYIEGKEIKDPDTNEVLGNEEILKAYLKVIHVQEKMSILESDETEKITTTSPYISAVLGTIEQLSPVTRKVMKPFILENNKEELAECGLRSTDIKENKAIKIGDFVKQVSE